MGKIVFELTGQDFFSLKKETQKELTNLYIGKVVRCLQEMDSELNESFSFLKTSIEESIEEAKKVVYKDIYHDEG
mgnify:CR=1 FL=1|jgi:hypothetical protein